nr:MAG TPA: Protein of unknown function (DUF1642) [Bacteriophage sp.]
MNKQELIEKFEQFSGHGSRCYIERNEILNLVKQLDEPQPVKVPPFVAVWYEENKDDFETSLFQCIYDIYKYSKDEELNEFENWIIDENTKPFQTLVNMHQFGYEVEEEKRYFVKVKATKHYISKDGIGKIFFSLAYKESFTKKELEDAGFGWVFDCPGIEIEEVE